MSKEKKDFLVCPECGSTDLHWLLGGRLGDQYKCSKCNYQGIALKGDEEFVKRVKKGK